MKMLSTLVQLQRTLRILPDPYVLLTLRYRCTFAFLFDLIMTLQYVLHTGVESIMVFGVQYLIVYYLFLHDIMLAIILETGVTSLG